MAPKVNYSALVKKQNNNDGYYHSDYLYKPLAHIGREARAEFLPNQKLA
ncbi:MAG: hypothetical protein KIT62_01390 [Cyclobacteriaceae bacterium]|nr:hypothetical protein [Cyclobacteriaceae bacterium]